MKGFRNGTNFASLIKKRFLQNSELWAGPLIVSTNLALFLKVQVCDKMYKMYKLHTSLFIHTTPKFFTSPMKRMLRPSTNTCESLNADLSLKMTKFVIAALSFSPLMLVE